MAEAERFVGVLLRFFGLPGIETQGQNRHDWLKHPSQKRTWLFKPARPERDRSLGEDVAEKLASEFARLVGIPAATVELAIRGGVRGALVEDVRLPNWELQAGQALIPEVVPDYNPDDPGRRGHNLVKIQDALRRFSPPPGCGLRSLGATDVVVPSHRSVRWTIARVDIGFSILTAWGCLFTDSAHSLDFPTSVECTNLIGFGRFSAFG